MNLKKIEEKMETLKSSTSLMIMYGVLSAIALVLAPIWNAVKFGFQ